MGYCVQDDTSGVILTNHSTRNIPQHTRNLHPNHLKYT